MNLVTIDELDLRGKRVLIREDLNVPIKDGIITSDQRIISALPTIWATASAGAGVIILSHLGRPEEGRFDNTLSLAPVAEYLAAHLEFPVRFVKEYIDGVDVAPGEIVVCENVRFNIGERASDDTLARKLAKLCDIFVMDAFGTAHRAHASTCGIAKYAPVAAAGPLLIRELEALHKVLRAPQKPIVAIVGGAKVSTKLSLLKHMVKMVDVLIPGGGIANTFLKCTGHEIGNSLYEPQLLDEAAAILKLAEHHGCEIPLPIDAVVGKYFDEFCPAFTKALGNIAADDMIMDVGPDTTGIYQNLLAKARTIIWNGPLGVFEFPQFAYSTRALAISIANSDAFSIAGGGDTLAAIDQYNLADEISYISTGGGAFLEYLEGKKLPAVAILEERAREHHPD